MTRNDMRRSSSAELDSFIMHEEASRKARADEIVDFTSLSQQVPTSLRNQDETQKVKINVIHMLKNKRKKNYTIK